MKHFNNRINFVEQANTCGYLFLWCSEILYCMLTIFALDTRSECTELHRTWAQRCNVSCRNSSGRLWLATHGSRFSSYRAALVSDLMHTLDTVFSTIDRTSEVASQKIPSKYEQMLNFHSKLSFSDSLEPTAGTIMILKQDFDVMWYICTFVCFSDAVALHVWLVIQRKIIYDTIL